MDKERGKEKVKEKTQSVRYRGRCTDNDDAHTALEQENLHFGFSFSTCIKQRQVFRVDAIFCDLNSVRCQ